MTIRHVLALLESHAEGDEERPVSIVLSITAAEARAGYADDANALKKAVQRVRDASRPAPMAAAPIRWRVPGADFRASSRAATQGPFVRHSAGRCYR